MPIAAVVLLLAAIGYYLAWRRSVVAVDGRVRDLHSRPGYYAWYVALLSAGPAICLLILWSAFDASILDWIVRYSLPADVLSRSPEALNFFMRDVARVASGGNANQELSPALEDAAGYYGGLQAAAWWLSAVLAILVALFCFWLALHHVEPRFRARNRVESWVQAALFIAATISILTTAGIVFSVLFESIRFFNRVPVTEFLFGLHWSPQTAIREDQIGSSGSFGAVPLFVGTGLITVIAMLVAGPIGIFAAMYLAEYAQPRVRSIAKPVMEILAGVPTVVYGFFAALTVAPAIRDFGADLGLSISSTSALAAGSVMGIMIIPFVSSLSDDAISSVPQSLRDASLGLGATKAETITKVVVPAALPGIIAGFLLAISRAIGETMIVVMAAGLAANLTFNPLDSVTTVTVQIVTILVGDQEFDSAKTLSAFALGLVLFAVTLMLNVVALWVMQKYREKYD